MVRHIIATKPSIDNVWQIKSSVQRVIEPFRPETEVEKVLQSEIEVRDVKEGAIKEKHI